MVIRMTKGIVVDDNDVFGVQFQTLPRRKTIRQERNEIDKKVFEGAKGSEVNK